MSAEPVNEAHFWKLRDFEINKRDEWTIAGCETFAMFLSSHKLCNVRHYVLFAGACARLGEEHVRTVGIAAAIKEERAARLEESRRRRGVPACPDCGSFSVMEKQIPGRKKLECRECLTAFGRTQQ